MQKRKNFSKTTQRQVILALYICLTVVMVAILTLIISNIAQTLEYKDIQKSLEQAVVDNSIEMGINDNRDAARSMPQTDGLAGMITRPGSFKYPVADDVPDSIDFSYLLDVNAQTIGWIYLSDSVINYPIMQSKDNEYYLNHLFDGQVNSAGSIFADYRTVDFKNDRCVIIYGHNIKNGSMFGGLKKYKASDYLAENKLMYIFVPDDRYQVEIIASALIKADDEMYIPSNWEDDYEEYVNRLVDTSTSALDTSVGEGDRYVLLSTCDYTFTGARLVVLGRLISENGRGEV